MMNELHILSTTLQKIVLETVANYRMKKADEEKRDAHAHLLFLFGLNLWKRGFQEDAIKLLAASPCSMHNEALPVLKAIAKDTHSKEVEFAIYKLQAQKLGYELDAFRMNRLQQLFAELTMPQYELIALIKNNLHTELTEDEAAQRDLLLNAGKALMDDAHMLKYGDYKPWGVGVSTQKVYESAIILLLASAHLGNQEGVKLVKRWLSHQETPLLPDLVGAIIPMNDTKVADAQLQQTMPEEKKTYDLKRFLQAQAQDYDTALMEIQDGAKESHWIWYIFPQLKGLGHSYHSQYYGLEGRGEACAYLQHPVLGARLREISEALLQHRKKSIYSIMGSSIDVLKLKTCMQLFDSISPNDVFDKVLDAFFKNEI